MIACQFQMEGPKALALRKFKRDLQTSSSLEDIAKCASEIYGTDDRNSRLLRLSVIARIIIYLLQTSYMDPFKDVY
jgi:hypothetical protein